MSVPVSEAPRPIPARLTRRQGLRVIATLATLPVGALVLQALAPRPRYHTWVGESLGGPARVTLWHPDARVAERTILRVRSEVERLESIFSLYRADSEITRLNREGVLHAPSPDLVATLEQSQDVAAASGGAFDPTVQPLWWLYESYFRRYPDATDGPPPEAVKAARRLVDHRRLDVGAARISLARRGMAITLNGIAQGYITDRVADLLRAEGFEHALVELGETRAVGGADEAGAWEIAIKDPRRPTAVNRRIALADAALSVSGGYGLTFGRSTLGHIFNPQTGASAAELLDVAVVAPRATVADALSTAIFVSGEQTAPSLLARYPGARATLTRPDGSTASL